MAFDSSKHKATKSDDGSFTAYSTEFEEHYHSTKDGALHESLCKHVLPALKHTQNKDEIVILDICFGLGFNTLATLFALKDTKKKVSIYSPEFDVDLVRSLVEFNYPDEFNSYKEIITALANTQQYESNDLKISIYLGDARIFLRELRKRSSEEAFGFDIVYQDAFSPSTNPLLWTSEYFSDIAALMKDEAILTTYSTALATRIALYENGLNVYLHKGEGFRNATLASKSNLEYEKVDMEHKMACNPGFTALKD